MKQNNWVGASILFEVSSLCSLYPPSHLPSLVSVASLKGNYEPLYYNHHKQSRANIVNGQIKIQR